VRFSNSPHLDRLLRSRAIAHRQVPQSGGLATRPGDETLASIDGKPVWSMRVCRGQVIYVASVPLPSIGHGWTFDYLNGHDFMRVLPLLTFLREAAGAHDWQRPALRACFTVDDPNLHRPRYGFLSYPQLVSRACSEGFHVAVATVPLDAWAFHAETVALLRRHRDNISLQIHGNDHQLGEMGQHDVATQQRLIAQALQRIERLERITGVVVDRVVVPPHEIMSDTAAAQMTALGLEGAATCPWSLRQMNSQRLWPAAYGLELAEMMDEGCPVVSRYSLDADYGGRTIIQALLGMPIVLSLHHTELADGLEAMSRAAALVGSFGEVRWCGVQEMLRANFLQRSVGQTLYVRPYAARFTVRVPENVSSIIVVTAHARPCAAPVWRRAGSHDRLGALPATDADPCKFDVEDAAGRSVTFVSERLGALDRRGIETPRLSLRALSRRLLCEARDRFAPSSSTVKRRTIGGATLRLTVAAALSSACLTEAAEQRSFMTDPAAAACPSHVEPTIGPRTDDSNDALTSP
jgi:hypothetical protein